jgi:hypothetical protein
MKWIQFNWLKVVAIIMVSAAVLPIPYFVYYQMMNWIVVGAAILTALQASTVRCGFVFWTFMLVAVVFNPLAPLHLRADVWQIADIVAALIFLISFFVVRPPAVVKK